jgi:hypothetical protein
MTNLSKRVWVNRQISYAIIYFWLFTRKSLGAEEQPRNGAFVERRADATRLSNARHDRERADK